MQGQPGLGVDTHVFMGDLITALCKTPDYSSADPDSKRGTIRLTLERIAAADEIEWLESKHYREYAPCQLEDLFATVFNKAMNDGDLTSIQVFNAARRAIDLFAFGSVTHPSIAAQQRVSPRLQAKKRDREAGADTFSESDRSSIATRKPSEATSAELSGQPAAGNEPRVQHPPELRRYPDLTKITGLTVNLYQKIKALKHVATPFTYKNDKWVELLDEAFIWMLHIQGSVSFSTGLRDKVYQLIFDTLHETEASPAVLAAIGRRPNATYTATDFGKQLKYRTHPLGVGKKATMQRYGAVPRTPYTSPLLDQNILTWNGRTQTLEESSLKAGDQGYEQLLIGLASNAQETQGSNANSFSFSALGTSSDGAGGSADALPAHPPSAATAIPGQPQQAQQVYSQVYTVGQGPFNALPWLGQGASSSVMGLGAATVGASALWNSMPPASNAPWGALTGIEGTPQPSIEGTPQPSNANPRKEPTKGSGRTAPKTAPPAAAAPRPEVPVRVIRAPEHLPVAVKQTLETLLTVKTVKSFQLLKDVNPEVKKDLCSLDAPYLVASVFITGKTLHYWVGKPVAKYDGKLICWYPSAAGLGSIETAGIFDQVEDITLPPTFVIKIIPEDGATDDAKHGDVAQAAVQDYLAEGKTTVAKTKALMKDTHAWLFAKCKIKEETVASQTQKRMVRAMINIAINDPDALAELQKYM